MTMITTTMTMTTNTTTSITSTASTTNTTTITTTSTTSVCGEDAECIPVSMVARSKFHRLPQSFHTLTSNDLDPTTFNDLEHLIVADAEIMPQGRHGRLLLQCHAITANTDRYTNRHTGNTSSRHVPAASTHTDRQTDT